MCMYARELGYSVGGELIYNVYVCICVWIKLKFKRVGLSA